MNMKKNLLFFLAGLMVIFGGMALSSCSDSEADAKINKFVEQLNSEAFKDQAVKSGVFTSAEAKAEGDVVELTFTTIPGLSFKNATRELMDAQKAGMLSQFREAVPADKVFREGFEGMKEKGMSFRMTFLDTNGDKASLDIAPSEVLE